MDNRPDHVVPADASMAEALAPRVRREHVREIADASGLSSRAALRHSLAVSVEAYAFVHPRGGVVFMMGTEAAGALTGSAVVWMVGAAAMDRHPASVLRMAAWGLRHAFAVTGAERVEQYIPAWYGTGLRFVRRLGFRLWPSSTKCRGGGGLWRATMERPDGSKEKNMGIANVGSYSLFSLADAGMGAYRKNQSERQANAENALAIDALLGQAKRKELEADEALRAGRLTQAELVRAGALERAAHRVGSAASGVKVNEGSSAAVAADSAAWTEYERQKVEHAANLESWGLRQDAALLRRQAALK